LVGYHGPSSVYSSGTSIVCSGAPSSTPDTGRLSELDSFSLRPHADYRFNKTEYGFKGAAAGNIAGNWDLTYKQFAPAKGEPTNRGEVGKSLYNNQGVFRIMVSVDPAAKSILMASAVDVSPLGGFHHAVPPGGEGVFGGATQIFAQGYNLSADASAFNAASSVYAGLVHDFDTGVHPGVTFDDHQTSGFYYQNQFVSDTSKQILLDESAANTFANAKNGALGTSNRSKLCTIYQADSLAGGEAYAVISRHAGHGVGFKSVNVFDLTKEE